MRVSGSIIQNNYSDNLESEENYRYKILESIKLLAEETWKEVMLYSMLHRMEQDKLIKLRWIENPRDKNRLLKLDLLKFKNIKRNGKNYVNTK